MRVIAGQFRGRRLQAPPGDTTRPILDRAKVALFDWLGALLLEPGALPPIHVLDVFCGAGSLGIEALSRGAASCVFVENDAAALRSLRENLASLGLERGVEILSGSADTVRLSAPPGGYGLIFLDPPYPLTVDPSPHSVLNRFLARLVRDVPLADEALLVWRYERGWVTPEHLPGDWSPPQRRAWGTIEIAIYRRTEASAS